jgi:hypothetical protein
VSTLDFELNLDARVSKLEREWRAAFEANIEARADYHTLAAQPDADLESIDKARERLEQSEALKSQILTRIDRLEQRFLGGN